MLSEETQEKLASILTNRIQEINEKILVKIGENIKKLGGLTASQAYQIQQMLKYGGDLQQIINELAKITNLNVKDIYKIFENEAKRSQTWAKQFYDYRGIDFIPYEQNIRLQRQVKALAKITAETYLNISKTSAIGYTIKDLNGNVVFKDISNVYKDTIDKAILSVSQGKSTYQEQMRDIIKQIGTSGLKTIDYETGRTRRLDSAIKMNLLGGIRDLSNEMQRDFGKEFDSDGVEISVHLNPAPDHELVQGRQFSNKEFDNFQNDRKATDYTGMVFEPEFEGHDRRSISEYNCYHYIFSIVLGVSKPQYSNEQLQEIIDNKNKTFEFDGKIYNMYEATQLQRKIETAIRQEKDTQILAKASGDEEQVLKSQLRITQLNTKYKQLSQISGLPTKKQRMSVSNYRKVSTKNVEKRVQKVYNTGNLYKDTSLYIQAKKRQEKIKNGEIDLTIKKDKQLQHIKNSEKYIVDKSYFNDKYSNIDKLQELVNEYAGKGRIIASKKGELINKEIITINENVGKYILKDNDEIIMNEDTNSFTIHYSKNGVHITPSRKRSDKK